MRIKSYFVKSVEEALAQARAELGEDALLLSTRKGPSPDGSGEGYEVVFGCADAEAARDTNAKPAGPIAPSAAAAAPVPVPMAAVSTPMAVASRKLKPVEPRPAEAAQDLEQLRSQMDEIHGLLLAAGRPQTVAGGLPVLDGVLARLRKAGFSAALAGAIVDGVAAELAGREELEANGTTAIRRSVRAYDRERVFDLLRDEMSARVKIDSQLGVKGNGCAVVALVGPGGSGKTTTLMKIAAFQAGPNRAVRLLALDGAGLGNRMQLQFFARKTGIAFTAVETAEALPALIEDARRKEIVLIDTPSQQTGAEREKLAAILARCPGIDVHLTLPGYMNAGACREAIRRYGMYWPGKLAVTKLDETPGFGAVVSEGVRAGLSLSLVTDGVSIPESLHSASVDDLMAAAMGPEQMAETACA